MHIDRNHSWLPPGSELPWWNLQGFLYLSDISDADNPTRLVSVRDSKQIESPYGVVMPNMEPGVYAASDPLRAGKVRTWRPVRLLASKRPLWLGVWRQVRSLDRFQERSGRMDRDDTSSLCRRASSGPPSWRARLLGSWRCSAGRRRVTRSGTCG